MCEDDELLFRSRNDDVGDHAVVQSRRVCVSVSLRPSARRERSSRMPPFKCSRNIQSWCFFCSERSLTECFEEVLSPLYPHPPIRRVRIYHSMVYLDALSIRLLVPGEILQPLPGAGPGQAGNHDIIHACDVPGWNVRHREALGSSVFAKLIKLKAGITFTTTWGCGWHGVVLYGEPYVGGAVARPTRPKQQKVTDLEREIIGRRAFIY